MEFNEVNNSGLTNLLFQNKQTAANNASAVAGMGFADLLAAPETDSEVKASSVSKDEMTHRIDTKKPAERKENAKENKTDSRAEAAGKNKNDKNVKEKSPSGKESKASDIKSENIGTPASQTSPVEKAPAESSPVAEKSDAPAAVEGVESAPAAPESGAQKGAEVNIEDLPLTAYAIPLADLSQMESVLVYDASTGTFSQMSGAELASMLSAQGLEEAQFLPVIGQDNVFATMLPKAEKGISLEGMEIVAGMETVVPETETVVRQAVATPAKQQAQQSEKAEKNGFDEKLPVSEKVAEQSSVIADKLAAAQKVKVEVNVKEENFAQHSSKDLLANAVQVDEVAADAIQETALTQSTANKANPAQQNNTPQLNLTPAANVAPVIQAEAAAKAPVAAAAADVSSVTVSHAGVQGSEFVQAAKLEAANDDKTSFREVYKGLSRETVDQIKVNITKSAVKGVDKIAIQLKPEDLGNIEVKLQIGKDGKLQAHIISSRPETMEALQKEMGNLEKAFNDAGFQTDEGSLSFSFRENSGEGQNGREGLRDFIGGVFEKEAGNELVSGEAYASWDGKSALNIRV